MKDGIWEAPEITNPSCVTGCGIWSPPLIANPAYKGGKWKPPMIPNPKYKGINNIIIIIIYIFIYIYKLLYYLSYTIILIGEWKPRQLLNPDISSDTNPIEHLSPIIGLAIEVWTTVGGIHIDNIIITNNLNDAFDYAKNTFQLKHDNENLKEIEEKRLKKQKTKEEKLKTGNWKIILELYLNEFAEYIVDSPVNMAIVIILVIGIVVLTVYLFIGLDDTSIDQLLEAHKKKIETEHNIKLDDINDDDNNNDNNKVKTE